MPIKKTDTPEAGKQQREVALVFSNGDLKALEEVKEKWKFKSEEDLVRFALAVMLKAENNRVAIDQGGNKITISPADSLLEEKDSTQE